MMDHELLQIITVFKKINTDMSIIIATSNNMEEGKVAIVQFQCTVKRLRDSIKEIQNSVPNDPHMMSKLIKINVTLIEIINHLKSILEVICKVSDHYLLYIEKSNNNIKK